MIDEDEENEEDDEYEDEEWFKCYKKKEAIFQ